MRTSDLLVGGEPLRVVRLSAEVADIVDRLRQGVPIGEVHDAGCIDSTGVARRLVIDGFAWAIPAPEGHEPGIDQVTVVVPALNAANELGVLLARDVSTAHGPCVVVDDGSTDATAEVAETLGATVVRHPASRGPAAARNTGWREADTPFVLFADADAVMPTDWREALAHFADPQVGLVIPRVRPTPRAGRPSTAEVYESARFVYDLGDVSGDVGPGARLSHATSVLLFVRREALADVGGFDEGLRFGEDFDLVRRLTDAGWTLRYEPRCVGSHRAREDLVELLKLHHHYGTPAAELAKRSGTRAAAGTSTRSAVVSVVVGLAGLPWVAVSLFGMGVAVRILAMAQRLPVATSLRVGLATEVRGVRTAMAAATSSWFPVALWLACRSRRGASFLAGLIVVRHLGERRRRAVPMRASRWTALRVLDDLALSSGVWRSCVRGRTVAPLIPAMIPVALPRPGDLGRRPTIEGWEDIIAVRGKQER